MFIHDMDPVAFAIGPVQVRYYGLLFALGFILGYFIMQRMFRLKGYNTADLDALLVYMFVGTVIGARLGHCLFYEPEYYLANPVEILKIYKGGLASHGGALGITLAFFIFQRRHRNYSFLEIADMLMIPIALVATMIRLGNFFNSEIIGTVSDGPFAVVFARLHDNLPRHPVQLYESFTYFMVFIVMCLCYKFYKTRADGFMLALTMILIFASRLFLEQFKTEQADYSTEMFLNVGQLLSLPFILAGVILLVYVQLKHKRS